MPPNALHGDIGHKSHLVCEPPGMSAMGVLRGIRASGAAVRHHKQYQAGDLIPAGSSFTVQPGIRQLIRALHSILMLECDMRALSDQLDP